MSESAEPLVTREELTVLLAHAGLNPAPAQFEEMFAAVQYVRAMSDRLKRDFTFADEPAHAFSAARF
ncbi:hypothetical protein DLJ53_11445 [Acuticoccus sediminis]|uniref:DUF4089 domain-containing protein n=1 Tax=Acuticoccus sediminis TaxID=2184697 RepID=A0A8B2NW31_9HYPH|nr:hypothetical protein [Acuticoccus sediminis]RAI01993.1 hypothetical protein DLJ53_11445 [Acuticoccus sediminis]